jgi:hypothetical protein
LESLVAEYVAAKREQPTGSGSSDPADVVSPADRLMSRLRLRSASRPQGNLLYRLYSTFKDFHSHKWMYDADSLSRYLRQAGFQHVVTKGFRESLISGIQEVEQPTRVLDGEGICVEAMKP